MIEIIDYDLDLTKEIKDMETIWDIRERKNKNLMLTDKLELRIPELGKEKGEYQKE